MLFNISQKPDKLRHSNKMVDKFKSNKIIKFIFHIYYIIMLINIFIIINE